MTHRHPSPRTDFELLDAWQAGDEDAGALLFERHYPAVARFFATKFETDYEDLIQATFLGCLERIEQFRREASFRTLLFAIARNKLLKRLRRVSRDRRYPRRRPSGVVLKSDAPSTGTLLIARSERESLLIALRTLPLDTQLMLELFYWEGLAVAEVARVVGLGINTVKTRMRRGRQQLARALEQLSSELDAGARARHGGLGRSSFEQWAREVREHAGERRPSTEVSSWS